MSKKADLPRVRAAIKAGIAAYSSIGIGYLGKNGEWDDIPLIVELLEAPNRGGAFLLADLADSERYKHAAKAVCSLGRLRLDELLAMSLPPKLKQMTVLKVTDAEFAQLAEVTLLNLLRSSSSDVRKVTALKCVKAFAKKRVTELLEMYLSDEGQVYYNVTHWLDMGTSLPRTRAVGSARRELERELRKR